MGRLRHPCVPGIAASPFDRLPPATIMSRRARCVSATLVFAWKCLAAAGSCFLVAACTGPVLPPPIPLSRTTLTNQQLDRVTAAASGLMLELSAFAQGVTATTSATGSIRATPAAFPLIEIDPRAPEPARAHLVGHVSGNLLFATGQTSATGDSAAQCSAGVAPLGSPTYFAQSATRTTSSTTAICNCVGFAITVP